MSSPPPSEAPTLRVPRLGIKNALSISSKKPNKEHLTMDHQQSTLLPMDQKQSTLIQLPPEIRRVIWQYVLGGKRIEIKEDRISRSKRFARYTFYDFEYKWSTMIQMDDGRPCSNLFTPKLRHVTCLLKTCRLVLWEAIDELYGCNRFIFHPASFWAASTEIMPHHFARLRIMYFWKFFDRDDRESWAHLCKTIGGMTNLRTLHMRLFETSTTYHDDHAKHRSGGLRHFPQKLFGSPKEPDPISEEFILDSLYQIKQVGKFKVELDEREKDLAMPEVRSNAPFKLICEYREDVIARWNQRAQEQRERELMKQREEAEERRLRKAQEEADRLRFELEQKAQEIVQSYQSFSA